MAPRGRTTGRTRIAALPVPGGGGPSVWSSVHGRILLGRPLGGGGPEDDVHEFIETLTRSLTATGPETA